LLSATTTNGKVSFVGDGTFRVDFTTGEMNMLSADTYEIGCTVKNGSADPVQFIIGAIAVFDGIVSQ
jgi:hypothetical protein